MILTVLKLELFNSISKEKRGLDVGKGRASLINCSRPPEKTGFSLLPRLWCTIKQTRPNTGFLHEIYGLA